MRTFKLGWPGDNGVGDELIRRVLSGQKTAAACPAYDPEEAEEGETLALVDKSGNRHGTIRVHRIEIRKWKDFDDSLVEQLGMSTEDNATLACAANSRELQPEENIRIYHFKVVSQ